MRTPDKSAVSFLLSVHSTPVTDGEGESQPCEDERVVCVKEDGSLLAGVLDGCGGTGGRVYPQADGWTGARLSSHLAGRALHQWFLETPTEELNRKYPEEIAEEIRNILSETLKRFNNSLRNEDPGAVRIRTAMQKDLPTTLAAVTVLPFAPRKARLISFWAGNSRNYILTCFGLQQISCDDLKGDYDPYEDLMRDGILSNSVNAAEPFEIRSRVLPLPVPCMILSASDGIFGYLDSPVRLEEILLGTLMEASGPLEWENRLRERFSELAGDDHTLQLTALGFRDFEDIRTYFAPRWDFFREKWIAPLNEAQQNGDAGKAEELWRSYSLEYMLVRKEGTS